MIHVTNTDWNGKPLNERYGLTLSLPHCQSISRRQGW